MAADECIQNGDASDRRESGAPPEAMWPGWAANAAALWVVFPRNLEHQHRHFDWTQAHHEELERAG
jgi:hypothetical protein